MLKPAEINALEGCLDDTKVVDSKSISKPENNQGLLFNHTLQGQNTVRPSHCHVILMTEKLQQENRTEIWNPVTGGAVLLQLHPTTPEVHATRSTINDAKTVFFKNLSLKITLSFMQKLL